MRKNVLVLTAVFAFMLTTWGIIPVQAANESFPKIVSFGTGAIGAAYNMVGVGAAKYWDKELGVKAKVAPGNAVGNLRRFDKGRLDMIVSPSTWGVTAWKGLKEYGFPKPIQGFRVLCYIYQDSFYFVSLKKSGLKNMADLKGKRVGVGTKAAVFDKIVGKRIEGNGLKYFGDKSDIKKTYASWQDMARLVGDGSLDACIGGMSGLAPHPAMRKLMEEKEIVALEWSEAARELNVDPVFPMTVIQKDLLPFLEKDHHCIMAGMASIVVRADFSDEFAYALIKTLHSNLPKLGEENPFFRYAVKFPEVLTFDSGLPFHPGAIKYWKEVGAWKR